MKLELHILQNFAPSNLNRDDTGSPKDCELGGVRRARISSQCYKRAIREAFVTHRLLDEGERATRTKRLVEAVAERVVAVTKTDLDQAKGAVVRALGGGGLKADGETWKTQYLLFLPSRTIEQLAALVIEHLEVLTPSAAEPEEPKADKGAKGKAGKSKKQEKADAKDEVPTDLRKQIERLLADGSRTPELGLFGRMIADAPEWNVDAACQVAHAISTHRVSMEFDFYTAIDDRKREDTSGSDMMGTIPFNSACFYRYLVVDVADLAKNLGGDQAAAAQARKTLAALLRAAVLAIPSGKQNSMAAHNPPSFILVDVRDGGAPRSLANAFVDPVKPTRQESGRSRGAIGGEAGQVPQGARRGVRDRRAGRICRSASLTRTRRSRTPSRRRCPRPAAAHRSTRWSKRSRPQLAEGRRDESVLLRLEGPLQAWGTQSRFPHRDTEREPSKSGVLGVVAAALGMPRDDDARLATLAAARMGVRADSEGSTLVDYHTAGAGRFAGEEHRVHGTSDPVITRRAYLADASFLVALGYEDAALAAAIDHALGSPCWPLFLGRRACPPSLPVRAGLVDADPEAALRSAPWPSPTRPAEPVRLILESAPGDGEPRQDQPLSFRLHARHFARRFVHTTWIQPGDLTLAPGDVPSTSLVALRRAPPSALL